MAVVWGAPRFSRAELAAYLHSPITGFTTQEKTVGPGWEPLPLLPPWKSRSGGGGPGSGLGHTKQGWVFPVPPQVSDGITLDALSWGAVWVRGRRVP